MVIQQMRICSGLPVRLSVWPRKEAQYLISSLVTFEPRRSSKFFHWSKITRQNLNKVRMDASSWYSLHPVTTAYLAFWEVKLFVYIWSNLEKFDSSKNEMCSYFGTEVIYLSNIWKSSMPSYKPCKELL